jgi:hypothetical protein
MSKFGRDMSPFLDAATIHWLYKEVFPTNAREWM